MKKVVVAKLTCPLGHIHPATDFHTYVAIDTSAMEDAVTIFCPEGIQGHGFSLRRAVASRMLTPEQAAKLCMAAEVLRQKAGRS